MDETLEVDVLIVGGGPAGMSAALRLAQLQKETGRRAARDCRAREGARGRRAHAVRRACSIPRRCRISSPTSRRKGAPLASRGPRTTTSTSSRAAAKLRLPITPPPLPEPRQLHHLAQPVREVAGGLVEAEGIDVFTGFPATEVLYRRATASPASAPAIAASTSTASGSRTFEPGVDIRAKVTIFTDGVRGNLTKSLVRRLGLDDGRSPQVYAIGIKELWEVPAGRMPRRHASSTRWAIR